MQVLQPLHPETLGDQSSQQLYSEWHRNKDIDNDGQLTLQEYEGAWHKLNVAHSSHTMPMLPWHM